MYESSSTHVEYGFPDRTAVLEKERVDKQIAAQKAADEARAAAIAKAQAEAKKPTPAPAIQPTGSIQDIIIAAANKYGIDPSKALRIAQCESHFNPNSVNLGYNENGNPSGLYQHLSGYWAARATKYGYAGASVFDPIANANVTMAMWADVGSSQWACK